MTTLALVTGAAGGIGSAVVQTFIHSAMTVVATDSDTAQLKLLASDGPGKQINRHMDVTDRTSVEQTARWLKEEFGHIDILVNAAGIFCRGSALRLDENVMRDLLAVNLEGCLRCTAVFGEMMAARRAGRIIQIASIAAFSGASMAGIYAATKAGIIAASKSAARELGSRNVQVNIVAPGFCDTDMLAPEKVSVELFVKPRIPVGRLAEASEVAELVTFLATSSTRYINGSVLTIDGGLCTE